MVAVYQLKKTLLLVRSGLGQVKLGKDMSLDCSWPLLAAYSTHHVALCSRTF